MGDATASGLNAWLRDGGLVVAASDRAARAVATAYHRARRAEGLTAWVAPKVRNWEEFARGAWQECTAQPRLILNPLQEQSLWANIVAADGRRAPLLEEPLHRVAKLAMEAHRLLCLYAPQFLEPAARNPWQQDAGAFSGWLTAFNEACRAGELISPPRVPLELIASIRTETVARPPLLLAGFDRILPTQRQVFDAWGQWREAPRGDNAEQILFYQAADESTELAACALWCKRRLAANPHARLLVITPDAAARRGEIERAFLRFARRDSTSGGASSLVEFSLGVPLKNVALARGALLVLRWLDGAIEEHELDWIFSTGQTAASEEESSVLTAFMRALRLRGLERTRWRFEDFSRQRLGQLLPVNWVARMTQAARRLKDFHGSSTTARATPIEWAELVPQLLQIIAWPGGRTLSSSEFQVTRRWQEVLDECASLGFDGRRIGWRDFLQAIERTMNETLFAPESEDAPILIAGPAESAGLTASAVWVLGASEDAWPASGSAHPLLPLDVQRDAAMPHASAQLDWDLTEALRNRLLASAPEVHFSFARQSEGVEERPSRLVMKVAGVPRDLPSEWIAPPEPKAQTDLFKDRSRISFSGGEVAGGSTVLTAQSQCAFKAFAVARLGAQGWERAEPGLTPAQRGQLLHAVLHAVWSGPPNGIRSHSELLRLENLEAWVGNQVDAVLQAKMPASARESMPHRYLELEQMRLTQLVTEWLRYEATRAPFFVEDTEVEREQTIGGLELRLRLDRVDRLGDDTFLVIDYKTGDVSQKSWELPRPEDVQLPLYAGFALDREMEPLGGLVFAKVRAGEQQCFAGRMFDAKAWLLPSLSNRSELVKRSLGIEDLTEWRNYIEKMVHDFLEGRAVVDPRDYPRTCERCGLQTLCRVDEHRPQQEKGADDAEETVDA